jgi:hypothetical protein
MSSKKIEKRKRLPGQYSSWVTVRAAAPQLFVSAFRHEICPRQGSPTKSGHPGGQRRVGKCTWVRIDVGGDEHHAEICRPRQPGSCRRLQLLGRRGKRTVFDCRRRWKILGTKDIDCVLDNVDAYKTSLKDDSVSLNPASQPPQRQNAF